MVSVFPRHLADAVLGQTVLRGFSSRYDLSHKIRIVRPTLGACGFGLDPSYFLMSRMTSPPCSNVQIGYEKKNKQWKKTFHMDKT